MKKFTKIGALVLAMMMILAMSVPAFAANTTHIDGEWGDFTDSDGTTGGDDPATQAGKIFKLEKQLKVFNVDEAKVQAPNISYTYTITPATVTAGTTITDAALKHKAGVAVTTPVKAGPALATNTVTVAWTTADEVDAGTDGVINTKTLDIDFSGLTFTGAGIYRYVVTEALTTGTGYENNTYAKAGVTDVNSTATDDDVRYFDVYVRPASPTPTGKTESDPEFWDIYGFTCFKTNDSITPTNKGTVKTAGFAAADADCYYTFNVELSKTVVNDAYGAVTVGFPFTVLFTNNTVCNGTVVTTKGTPTGNTVPATEVDLSAGALKGIATLKNNETIKYIGIPCGTSVEVYETNVATGVTYMVETLLHQNSTTESTTVDNAVISGTAPSTAVAQAATKADYESSKATFSTTADADTDNDFCIDITNTLLLISPTGVVLRVAPFVGIMGAGLFLLLIAKRFKKDEDEDEDAVLETIPQHN